MRARQLLGSEALDGAGRRVGAVRDVRLVRTPDGRLRVTGLVVGGGFLAGPAHAWGFAEGRASGPWLLRKLLERAARQARFVPASAVRDWGPGTVRIASVAADLADLNKAEA